MGIYATEKLIDSLNNGVTISSFRNYRNEVLSEFTMPMHGTGYRSTSGNLKTAIIKSSKRRDVNRLLKVPNNDISTIDQDRMKEIDNLFKAMQIHRTQYKDKTGELHPLAFFQPDVLKHQCPSGITKTYLSRYPVNYVEYRPPITLPITYSRRRQCPYIPELSLRGVYNQSSCNAYKR